MSHIDTEVLTKRELSRAIRGHIRYVVVGRQLEISVWVDEFGRFGSRFGCHCACVVMLRNLALLLGCIQGGCL